MKSLIALFSASLCLVCQPIFAAPTQCPDINTIKATFVNASMVDTDEGTYEVMQISDYGTKDIWAFGIVNIPASNSADALAKAKAAIPTLAGAPAPAYFAEQNVYYCLYEVGYNYGALAITGFQSTANTIKAANFVNRLKHR